MRGLLWVLLGGAAILAHELLVWRASPRVPLRLLRISLLGVALIAAVGLGPRVVDRVTRLTERTAPMVPGPAISGDPFFDKALTRLRPEHPFPAEAGASAVETWRASVLAALATHVGLPAIDQTAPVSATTVRVDTAGAVRRTLIQFPSWDGTSIPAYVLAPTNGPTKGAVLVVPGHGNGIRATAGLIDDYQHHGALALAENGYITLTPELRGFGYLGRDGQPNHRGVAAAALEAGTSYKAIVVKDLGRALTVLAHWPGVDANRLAVAGTSLGGELAVLLGVLDSRVRVVMSHSYGGEVAGAESFDGTDEDRQTPHGCHTIPGINRIVEDQDWLRLVSPRPLLVVRGERNTPKTAGDARRDVAAAFSALGAPERFSFETAPGGHEFYLEPTVRFLQRWL
jgi:dienelactone hydrolase